MVFTINRIRNYLTFIFNMWIIILIFAIIIGAFIGAISSKDGEKGEGAIGGAITGGIGCGYILLQIFISGLGILFILWIFSALCG